jgi:diaminohydroxyphosphoribosylaminopyrimidine deaminase / 5-amino-6-(5-phosphoribosylamino)uracil reductase
MTINMFNAADSLYMAEAIALAKKGLFTTDPNPRVGCVLVKNGEVVGRGWHRKAGTGHAEVNALAESGSLAQGACAYVTLEPCSHFGRTPPCAQALIDAGVSRVVAAMQDPNPSVSGRGFAMLRKAGIQVSWGLMEQEARALNPGFIKRMESGLPWVRIKQAISLDGRTAMASGESQWITGAAARSDVQRWRARSSAIVSGIGTLLHDDAALTVRPEELGFEKEFAEEVAAMQPLRVILDRNARLPRRGRLLAEASPVLWCVSAGCQFSPQAQEISELSYVKVLRMNNPDNGICELQQVFAKLAELQCNEVLVEAGAELVGSIIAEGLWDELLVYMAPKLLGSNARALANLPLATMSQAKDLQLNDVRQLGNDIRMTYVAAAKA